MASSTFLQIKSSKSVSKMHGHCREHTMKEGHESTKSRAVLVCSEQQQFEQALVQQSIIRVGPLYVVLAPCHHMW